MEVLMHPILLDAAGHRRQPVTLSGYHAGRPPRNKGRRYPADPPTVEEIIAVMRTAGAGPDGMRLRALIVVLWRAGLRIGEALALAETDLDARRGAVLVRHGKGDKRREVGMDSWAWEQLEPWQAAPRPVSGRLVVLRDPRSHRRAQLGAGVGAPPTGPDRRRSGSQASVRAPSAAPRARDRDGPREIPLPIIQRQLGHAHLGVTSIYLQGIDNAEIIDAVHARRPPVIPAAVGLRSIR